MSRQAILKCIERICCQLFKKITANSMGTKMSHCTHCLIIMKNTYLTKYNVIDGVIKVALMLFAFIKNTNRIVLIQICPQYYLENN